MQVARLYVQRIQIVTQMGGVIELAALSLLRLNWSRLASLRSRCAQRRSA
ncbi:MAG: hypothetical protein R2911_19465 [Caldilineaceae bacterium]